MTPAAFLRRPVALWAASAALLLAASLQLRSQAGAIRAARDLSLPIAGGIPALERRLSVLEQETEAGRLHAQLRPGSPEEKVHLYVFPESGGADRALTFLEILRDTLAGRGELRALSTVDVADGAALDAAGPLRAQRIALTVVLNEEGMASFLRAIPLTGLVTVADALSAEERRALILEAERVHPAAIAALGQFFAADLFAYARSPRAAEERLLASIPSEDFAALLRRTVGTSLLREAQEALQGDLGAALLREKLWPLPFLTLEEVTVEADDSEWLRASLILQAYGKSKEEKEGK